MRLNIRWRLTLWNTLALAVVLACFALLVHELLRRALIEQTDRVLTASLDLLRHDPRIGKDTHRRLLHWVEEFKDHQGLYCVLYRPDGSVYAASDGLGPETIPPLPEREEERWTHETTLPTLGRQRMLVERVHAGGMDLVVLLLAPLQAIDEEMRQVRSVLLMAGPIALVLAGAFAYMLARKALAPVDRLRRDANAISAEHLHRRLPVANPHDELGRLAHTINAMIGRLDNSFAEIRRFTADASHELRTPLTALRAEVEVTLDKTLTVAEHQQLLASLLEELTRMSRMTDQLLALSRRDAGVEQMARESVNLCVLANDVVEALRPLADARGVPLRLEAPDAVTVSGDEARLRQVFINLLDNALKYTPVGGSVVVEIRARGDEGIVVVRDTGIGIAAEHLPRVFDRFYRVDKARSRAEGGTGLGLSIAQSIVLAHGGRIEMTSTPRLGTTCTVSLPLRAPADAAS